MITVINLIEFKEIKLKKVQDENSKAKLKEKVGT